MATTQDALVLSVVSLVYSAMVFQSFRGHSPAPVSETIFRESQPDRFPIVRRIAASEDLIDNIVGRSGIFLRIVCIRIIAPAIP